MAVVKCVYDMIVDLQSLMALPTFANVGIVDTHPHRSYMLVFELQSSRYVTGVG